MLLVQELVCRWTKRSRGAPGAALRNAVPPGLALPEGTTRAPCVVHRVSFDERHDFEPELVELVAQDEVRAELAGLHLMQDEERLRVRFSWSFACGAPRRPNGPSMDIVFGAWSRILHNGRFGGDGGFSYQSTVLNVALVAGSSRSLFVDTQPAAVSDHRTRLW